MEAGDRLTLVYLQTHPVEAARRLEPLPSPDAAALLAPFDSTDIALVLEHLLPDAGAALLGHLPIKTAAAALSHVTSSAASALLRQCGAELQSNLVARLTPDVGPTIQRALTYPANTAGSLADPRILTLAPDLSVREALDRVSRDHSRATYYLYVLDRAAKLTGIVSLKELLAADPNDRVGSVMSTELVSVAAASTAEELLSHPNWRVFHTMPVVDRNGAFLGALRYRTLRMLEDKPRSSDRPPTLSGGLIALWEAYALAGIRVMTDVAEAMMPGQAQHGTATKTTPHSPESRDAGPQHPA